MYMSACELQDWVYGNALKTERHRLPYFYYRIQLQMINDLLSLHRQFFTARVYAKLLHNDPYGRISIMQFFNYVMRKGIVY